VYKCAGAAAEGLASLEDVKRIADKVCANVRTMGVALSPCVVPEVGKPSFSIGENEMELGMGIHGEPGIERGPLKSADEVVQVMMEKITADLPYRSGDEVAVLVNGLGATPKEELYVMYRKAAEILKALGIKVFHACPAHSAPRRIRYCPWKKRIWESCLPRVAWPWQKPPLPPWVPLWEPVL